jgi:hypothetical protein
MRMFTLAAVSPVLLLHLIWISMVTVLCCIAAINLMRKRLIV